jgi:Arm domain-containing DNA-binding protein
LGRHGIGLRRCGARSGKKTYAVQYRQNGVSRRATIGEHGRLTPDQARSEAKKLLGAVESGSDPVAEREATRKARTFGEIAAKARRNQAQIPHGHRIPANAAAILPALGAKRISDLIAVWRSCPRCGIGQRGATRLGRVDGFDQDEAADECEE